MRGVLFQLLGWVLVLAVCGRMQCLAACAGLCETSADRQSPAPCHHKNPKSGHSTTCTHPQVTAQQGKSEFRPGAAAVPATQPAPVHRIAFRADFVLYPPEQPPKTEAPAVLRI